MAGVDVDGEEHHVKGKDVCRAVGNELCFLGPAPDAIVAVLGVGQLGVEEGGEGPGSEGGRGPARGKSSWSYGLPDGRQSPDGLAALVDEGV